MKVDEVREARNLVSAKAGRGNTGKLPAAEPRTGSWDAKDPEDRNYIYRGQKNRLCYEKYGGRNYSYEPYRNYYTTDWPPINPTPITPPQNGDLPAKSKSAD